jgi:transcriptional regulator with XRE-family HTH domain
MPAAWRPEEEAPPAVQRRGGAGQSERARAQSGRAGTNGRAVLVDLMNPSQLSRLKESTMPSLLREVVGDVLRRARTKQGRTLREVSDVARVSLGYLSEVERGRKEASSELLSAICDALDVSLSQLLVEAGEQLARREHTVAPASAANIDASTKVVIPSVVSMAVA